MAKVTDEHTAERARVAQLMHRLLTQAMAGETQEGGAWLRPDEENQADRVIEVVLDPENAILVLQTSNGLRYRAQVTGLSQASARCGHLDYQGGTCADMACWNYYGKRRRP